MYLIILLIKGDFEMKRVKKLAVILMTFMLLVCAAGCGKDKSDKKDDKTEVKSDVTVRVGSLKGPTSIGLVDLMKKSDEGTALGKYTFTIAAQADEITSALVKGDLDIALIPANAASILYNKTEGKVTVIDINTLGVLYCVTGDGSITKVEDLGYGCYNTNRNFKMVVK